ncbi:MAG TPA: OmpA family protein [Anaeromyxobacteraceae bacterium]|nr:OmpA family protein [Anaeromyxobacteraceae bacterium]
MRTLVALLALALAAPAAAEQAWDIAKKAAGGAAVGEAEKAVNKKLLEEGRKNQCVFKTDSDAFEKPCDAKLKNLVKALVDAKKKLNGAGVKNFKFEVSGHTDSRGDAAHNKELSARRADVIRRELVKRGVAENEIVSVGMGSERRLVKPDDTPAKQAKNRRYEIQVRL